MVGQLLSTIRNFDDVRKLVGQVGFNGVREYTPEWTATTTNPTIGNGTLRGVYLTGLGMCWASIELIIGSTTTLGSGTYELTVPLDPHVLVGSIQTLTGCLLLTDLSAAKYGMGVVRLGSARNAGLYAMAPSVTGAGEIGALTEAKPFAWAAGDSILASIGYPIN